MSNMENTADSYIMPDTELTYAELPCQNCGKMVLVSVPFVGCVFCADCIGGDSSYSADSEHFHDRWLTYGSLLSESIATYGHIWKALADR